MVPLVLKGYYCYNNLTFSEPFDELKEFVLINNPSETQILLTYQCSGV